MPIYPDNKPQSETPLVLLILLFMVLSAALLLFLSSDNENSLPEAEEQIASAGRRMNHDKRTELVKPSSTKIRPTQQRIPVLSKPTVPEAGGKEKAEQPSKVRVILKVFPEETKFKLSMVKPEELDLGEPQSNVVELMMNAGVNYILKLESPEGVRRFVQLKPGGEAEYHYVNF